MWTKLRKIYWKEKNKGRSMSNTKLFCHILSKNKSKKCKYSKSPSFLSFRIYLCNCLLLSSYSNYRTNPNRRSSQLPLLTNASNCKHFIWKTSQSNTPFNKSVSASLCKRTKSTRRKYWGFIRTSWWYFLKSWD
jgi:hypothetical protein